MPGGGGRGGERCAAVPVRGVDCAPEQKLAGLREVLGAPEGQGRDGWQCVGASEAAAGREGTAAGGDRAAAGGAGVAWAAWAGWRVGEGADDRAGLGDVGWGAGVSKQTLFGTDLFGNAAQESRECKLAADFIIPPFSVLSARDGAWQDRKRRWLSFGIKSEIGRDALCFNTEKWVKTKQFDGGKNAQSGISIFDPVICELAYRWFCPTGGQIIDPFAGGSVRGIVADLLGYRYWGVDLRPEQVAANREQAKEICAAQPRGPVVERRADYLVYRGDLWERDGAIGGKARTCYALAAGAVGLVTAGSRSSPQVNIVAHVARALGIPCRVHVPTGELSPELVMAQEAGAEVVQHQFGYNSVICRRAMDDAQATGYRYIPFGMECSEAVVQTERDVDLIPSDVTRIVIPVGSGMSLAGVLHGIRRRQLNVHVVGICVGADPEKRLEKFAPLGWRDMVSLIKCGSDYHEPAAECMLDGLRLDAWYEAKCLPYLNAGDMLWVVGIRATERVAEQVAVENPAWVCGDAMDMLPGAPAADFIFSCPPYGDLERYSDDPRDLSTMDYHAFIAAYRRIIMRAIERLKQNRFACFVVGDFRNPKTGAYRNFVSDTIESFRQCGLELYNEAILVTAVGSLPIRVGKQFTTSRKMGKTHQNILVFVKGDGREAARACGDLETGYEYL